MKHPSLYRLQQDTLRELDFDAAARREGKRTLWERHGAVLAQHYGLPEAALAHVVQIRRQLRWRDVVLPIVVEVSHHSPYVPTSSTI